MPERNTGDRPNEPTLFMPAVGQEIEDTAEMWANRLEMPLWPLFDDISRGDRGATMDFLTAQGLYNVRDLLLIDPLLTELNFSYGNSMVRDRVDKRLKNRAIEVPEGTERKSFPWSLNDKPSIERDAQMCRTLSDIPLQVVLGDFFGAARHRLVGDRRVTVADALANTANFNTICRDMASSVGEKALRYAQEFNDLKGYNLPRVDKLSSSEPSTEE